MTAAMAGDGGGPWMLGQRECLSRLMLQESSAEPAVRLLYRSRGRDMVWATPATSRRWRPGLPSGRRRVRPVNCWGVAWRRIGSIITRVNNDVEATVDRLEGLRRIGIDEISYKRGHRYLIVVVDHDTGRLVWAGPGRSEAALDAFFDELGEQRAAEITHVSADMADWIAKTVARRAPNAIQCADPFHVVAWAIEALDVERRRAWNQAKGRKIKASPGRLGRTTGDSRKISRSRYALWKNPADLNPRQRHQLEWIAKTDPRLWRAYLLKEGLRYVCSLSKEKKAKKHSTVSCHGPAAHSSQPSSTSPRRPPDTVKPSTPTSTTVSPKA